VIFAPLAIEHWILKARPPGAAFGKNTARTEEAL
jgi:hypothetical protein